MKMYTTIILNTIFLNSGENMDKALRFYQEGQDRTTCLLMTINKFRKENVYAISFIYNNKYKKI